MRERQRGWNSFNGALNWGEPFLNCNMLTQSNSSGRFWHTALNWAKNPWIAQPESVRLLFCTLDRNSFGLRLLLCYLL